jgi:hypothetical protein
VEIYFQKIKFKHLGKQGIISLDYDYVTGRFNQGGKDQSNWLVPEYNNKQIEFYEAIRNEEEVPF